jgi:RNA polymerase sigma-70 factor (ECF subfamily)
MRMSKADPIEDLYREEGPKMWRALMGFARDPEVAGDAIAEAFAQALARGDELRDPASWIWKVAFQVAAGNLKDRHRVTTAQATQSYEMSDPIHEVIDALAQISPSQRLAVVLHDFADRPTAEIAEVTGSSQATVRVHLSQGRRRLRKLLEDHDG